MTRVLAILSVATVVLIGGPATAGEGGDQTSVFRVEGMTCGLCAKAIDKAVQGVDGVRSVEIDQQAERVAIVANASLPAQRLEEAIESAGRYEAELVE